MSSITEMKNDAKELIENLKKLPPSKQEYVNGYVQGIADTIAEKAEQQKTAL
jgi:hypothetical protein